MNLLLDTHTILWFITGDKKLSGIARTAIDEPANVVFVSIVSVWEIAIKVSINKIALTEPFDDLFPAEFHNNGFSLLPIEVEDTSRVSTLPLHHRDPFDRLLIAQAQSRTMSILSVDDVFDSYGVTRLW